jgi:hypothetical protein
MSDLSPETDKLLALARGAGGLTSGRRAQIKAGLFSQIAAGGALGAAASHATWGKAAWLSSPLAKSVSALAVLSIVGVGVYVGARAPRHASSAMPAVSASAVVLASAKTDRAASTAAPAANVNDSDAANPGASAANGAVPDAPALDASSAAPSAASTASTPGSMKAAPSSARSASASEGPSSASVNADTLAEETRLLREADQTLRAGNAQRALTLLDEQAARFPRGVLEPERAAERMIARCKLGQVDAKSAQNYLAAHASSPFAARLRDACSGAKP